MSLDPLAYIPPAAPVSAAPKQPEEIRRYQVPLSQDAAALAKMAVIRDKVVSPALTGAGLIYTRSLLAEILQGSPASANGHKNGRWALACRIFFWLRFKVRYVLDPAKKELFQQLPVTVRLGMGDCDDMTGALAALLKASGLRVKARCVKLKPGGPYAHIYPLVAIGPAWIALDATTPNPPGWECRNVGFLDLEL